MKELGVNSYRFSISWPRVIPLGGKDDPINEEGLQFYSDVIDECLRLGITPFVVSDWITMNAHTRLSTSTKEGLQPADILAGTCLWSCTSATAAG